MSQIRIKSSAKTLPRGPGEIAKGWQYLQLSGTSVSTTSDTLFKTSTNSGLVRRIIGSTAILSLFRTHSKVSIFRCGLRTSGSVEFRNVQFKAKFDICPSRFINQLDQLHQSKTFADMNNIRKWCHEKKVLAARCCFPAFSLFHKGPACYRHSSQSVSTARTTTFRHCTYSARQDRQHLSAG